MYDDNGTQADTTETQERKPPTLADIVREKTDDGARIIDFFLDVMEGRVDGAELCHRIDAGKQLAKYGSKDAAEFIAKYKDVPCGHSTRRRGDSADPCIADERTLVEVTLNAPPTLTREFLTVLSGIDEFLMTRLIRAQTADGGTIIDFLYDVMQDTTDGFKTHHRIAAAKELIAHIVCDEQGSHTPSPAHPTVVPVETEPAPYLIRGTHPSDPAPSSLEEPAYNVTVVPPQAKGNPDNPTVVPAKAGTHPSAPALSSAEEPADNPTVVPEESEPAPYLIRGTHPSAPALSSLEEPADNSTVVPPQAKGNPDNLTVVPEKSGTQGRGGARTTAANSVSQLETNNSKLTTLPRTRRTRTQRRRDGAAKAAIRRKALGFERIEEKKHEKPAPAELTPAERRIKEKLQQHWHEPEPWDGPIDSTNPGRSPPW